MDRRGSYSLRDPKALALLVEIGDWLHEAECGGADPDLFFPERGASTRLAKAICARCSVRPECLDYALRTSVGFGVWGGMSEMERRRLRRDIRR